MHLRSSLLLIVACSAACGSDPDGNGPDPDAGGSLADARVAPDASTTPDARPGPGVRPFPLPLYRVGPRFQFNGFFGGPVVPVTIAVPSGTVGVTSFADWQFIGHGPAPRTAITAGATRTEDGNLVADLTVDFDFATTNPITAREILTAMSPDGTIVLTTTLTDDGRAHFTVRETARQVLAIAGVREQPIHDEAVYWFGARAGDDAAIDAACPAVEAAIAARLTTAGTSGITVTGFASPSTPVFAAVDAAVGSLDAPLVTAPATTTRLGIVDLAAAGEQAAFSMNGAPLPHIPADQTRFSFFFYTLFSPGPTYLRVRAADGAQSRASAVFAAPTAPDAARPGVPAVAIVDNQLRACGGSPEHWMVFLTGGTELATGFAAAEVGADGCAVLPPEALPEGADLHFVETMQVSPDLRISESALVPFD
jgi:hypothetical protein